MRKLSSKWLQAFIKQRCSYTSYSGAIRGALWLHPLDPKRILVSAELHTLHRLTSNVVLSSTLHPLSHHTCACCWSILRIPCSLCFNSHHGINTCFLKLLPYSASSATRVAFLAQFHTYLLPLPPRLQAHFLLFPNSTSNNLSNRSLFSCLTSGSNASTPASVDCSPSPPTSPFREARWPCWWFLSLLVWLFVLSLDE